jgi:hypothetical protein
MNKPAVPRPHARLALLASMLVGAVLLFSAYTKILAPQAFVATITQFGLLPHGLELMVATGLIGIEFALAVLLLTGISRRLAATLTLPLLLGFIALLIYAMRLGMESCGCFGESLKIPPPVEIVIDSVLVLLIGVVLWRGEDVRVPGSLASVLGWGSLCLGAALFLAAGPAASGEHPLKVEASQLQVLAQAQPPLTLPRDGLLFFFSADCPHCWAFAGTVEGLATRLENFAVHGVTLSDAQALADFTRDFAPSYPIHMLSSAQFHQITDEYPAALWLQGGQIVEGWAGFVPSHKEIASEGGYLLREGPLVPVQEPVPTDSTTESAPPGSGLFGGPIKARG